MATQNNTQNFVKAKGKTKFVKVLMTASVAAEEGSLMYPDPSNAGQYTVADATAGNFFGVIRQTIATTDDDYASTKLVSVEIPVENNVEWFFTVGSGTFTAADVGKIVDLADEKSLAVDSTSKLVARITQYISSTRGKCVIFDNVALPATT